MSVDDHSLASSFGPLAPTFVEGTAADSGFIGYSWNASTYTLTVQCDPTFEVMLVVAFYSNSSTYSLNDLITVNALDSSTFVSSYSKYHIGNAGNNYQTYRLIGSNTGYEFVFTYPYTNSSYYVNIVAYNHF